MNMMSDDSPVTTATSDLTFPPTEFDELDRLAASLDYLGAALVSPTESMSGSGSGLRASPL
jgi:hypothetical protein